MPLFSIYRRLKLFLVNEQQGKNRAKRAKRARQKNFSPCKKSLFIGV